MVPEVRQMFHQVERLLRILLTCPVLSCAVKRSFSALKRLKTWLGSTMGQQRLNSLSVCHVYQEILDSLDLNQAAKDFAGLSSIRQSCFGNFV